MLDPDFFLGLMQAFSKRSPDYVYALMEADVEAFDCFIDAPYTARTEEHLWDAESDRTFVEIEALFGKSVTTETSRKFLAELSKTYVRYSLYA